MGGDVVCGDVASVDSGSGGDPALRSATRQHTHDAQYEKKCFFVRCGEASGGIAFACVCVLIECMGYTRADACDTRVNKQPLVQVLCKCRLSVLQYSRKI